MSKKPLILGIETSCDETAASIISENNQGNPIVLSNSFNFFLFLEIKISFGLVLSKKVSVNKPFVSIAGKSFNA